MVTYVQYKREIGFRERAARRTPIQLTDLAEPGANSTWSIAARDRFCLLAIIRAPTFPHEHPRAFRQPAFDWPAIPRQERGGITLPNLAMLLSHVPVLHAYSRLGLRCEQFSCP